MNILLLGNGINLVEGLTSDWNSLLAEIAEKYGHTPEKSLSMTLGYEMLENLILKSDSRETESSIHRVIAEKIENDNIRKKVDWSNSIHATLMSLPVTEIMTTNYDYSLEHSIKRDFKKQYRTKETIYSLQRFQETCGKKVFHIHGECGYPRSICLGFEQYAGSLQRIRSELTRPTRVKDKNDGRTFQLADVLAGISDIPENSWIYHFFVNDITILGLKLDSSEIDLWWLLSYRSKLKTTGKLPIQNRIRFLETSSNNTPEKKELSTQKEKLFKAFDIEYILCHGDRYEQRYEEALNHIVG